MKKSYLSKQGMSDLCKIGISGKIIAVYSFYENVFIISGIS